MDIYIYIYIYICYSPIVNR